MILPSKKLMSAVLNEDVIELQYDEDIYGDNIIGVSRTENLFMHYNIYELMHLMKEWTGKTEYYFTIFLGGGIGIDINKKYKKGMNTVRMISVSGSTEFEAVTKACELILEQQK